MDFYEVGGCVRDTILGLKVKDIDYTVVGPSSFEEMCAELEALGFFIYERTEHTFNAKCKFPAGWAFGGHDYGRLDADVVLARKESGYSDGRHPDNVTVGTLYDDLARRDFTVNAIAKDKYGRLIDPFGGIADIETRMLRAVGGARRSFTDDALRVMRALRFVLTKGFTADFEIMNTLEADWLPDCVRAISFSRRMEELDKMLRFDTLATISLLETLPFPLRHAILDGYRLTVTNKQVKNR